MSLLLRPGSVRVDMPEKASQQGIPRRIMYAFEVLAVLSLISDFGFSHGLEYRAFLMMVDLAVAVMFSTDLVLTLWESPTPRAVLRQRWYEYAVFSLYLLVMVGMAVFVTTAESRQLQSSTPFHSTVLLQMGITRLFILSNLALRFLRIQVGLLGMGFRPEYILVTSFAMLVLIGFGLLMLPRAIAPERPPIAAIDALFTATSAVCVTGLTVRDTGLDFSGFGQVVILGLIQVGGMGIITFVALVSVLSSRTLSIPQMVFLRDIVNARSISDVRRYVLGIAILALGIELLGSMVLYSWVPDSIGTGWDRWAWAVFHSISAFCNAGFSTHGEGLVGYVSNWGVNLGLVGLIVLGGLGFPVMLDLLAYRLTGSRRYRRWHFLRKRSKVVVSRLTVHTRISLVMTAVLIVGGTIGFWLLESNHILSGMSLGTQFLASLFQAVTPRTAGFNTVDIGQLQDSTLILIMVLMVIGAGPVSTGGGIKTVAMGVLILSVAAMLRGRDNLEVFGRTLPRRLVLAAITVFVVYIAVAVLVIFGLSITDPQMTLQSQAFETISALSTVGLTTGITPQLSTGSKMLIIMAMFIGRIGPLTLVMSVVRTGRPQQTYQYPNEDVIVS